MKMLGRLACLLMVVWGMACAETIKCEGTYEGHLQGIDADGTHIYWSFTTVLVKTDMKGKIVKSVKVPRHCGDISVYGGKIYTSINKGKFNLPNGSKDSLLVLNAETLEEIKTYPVEGYNHGFGAVEYHNGHLFLTGGLPKEAPANIILEYTEDMQFVKRHESAGYTNMGIQTLNYAFGHWWYGTYDKQPANVLCDDEFKVVSRLAGPNLSVGMAVLEDGTVLIAKTQKHETEVPATAEQPNPKKKVVWSGTVQTASYDPETKTLAWK